MAMDAYQSVQVLDPAYADYRREQDHQRMVEFALIVGWSLGVATQNPVDVLIFIETEEDFIDHE